LIRRALISVHNKDGVVELARALWGLGVEVISTGGTARLLAGAGLPVRQVSEVTGFPEILDGRVKTLHPAVHGGILAVRGDAAHERQLSDLGIRPVDLVVVNLYPFRATIMKPGVAMEEIIENIDIGGPAMIRSAAKNHRDVVVLVDPADYSPVLDELRATGEVAATTRFRLAARAFEHTAAYDALISRYLAHTIDRGPLDFPDELVLSYRKAQGLRYGENPHQAAAFYLDALEEALRAQSPGDRVAARASRLAAAVQVHGRELSYNNIGDADGAVEAVREFGGPAAVAVKHGTPCGAGTGSDLAEAYRKAHDGDPVSIFGGVVAVNGPVDETVAREMNRIFLEVVIAPAFTDEALVTLRQKKDLRLLILPGLEAAGGAAASAAGAAPERAHALKAVGGGLLVQSADAPNEDPASWTVVSRRAPTAGELADLAFAWAVVKHVRSNAIVLARGGMTTGIGGGQTNRIDAARHAIARAGDRARGSVLASDAFFPFPDVALAAAEAGITAICHPGGSLRDEETRKVADEHGLALLLTGIRHFRH
jgi:phosphoribosylaminoimidazolecarboxamide formyltransferase/IMP cyclohydrolase